MAEIEVIATELGFYGGARRREGDTFHVAKGETASWYRPVDGKADIEQARAEVKAKAKAKQKAQGDGVKTAKDNAVAKAKAESGAEDDTTTGDDVGSLV
jgi:hypothetical protein